VKKHFVALFLILTQVFVIAGLLTGCAADPANIQKVAEEESRHLTPATKPLSSFLSFELAPITLSDAIEAEPGKIEEAREFEGILQAKLAPLLAKWNTADNKGAAGALTIETHLVKLKIVSGGARFWSGACAGDSFIDLNLKLVDSSNSELIADVLVRQRADAMTGGWSVGGSDQNIDAYVVAIIHQYLSENY